MYLAVLMVQAVSVRVKGTAEKWMVPAVRDSAVDTAMQREASVMQTE